MGSRHTSVVLSAPTILWPQVRIPSTPSTLLSFIAFSICIIVIVMRNGRNKQKEDGIFNYEFEIFSDFLGELKP